MADSEQQRGFKRKRKKSFLTKQKQHGKKGRYGRGVQLSEDNYQYFIRIMEVIRASKDCQEDMEMLANNVVEEMKGKEVETCSNQLASRVVEELLGYAPDEKLLVVSNAFGAEFRLVFTDQFCSHVLQKLIITLAKRILSNGGVKSENDVTNPFIECFVRIAKFALNNLEDFIFDTYANHILRTLFACVNGHAVKMEVDRIEMDEEVNRAVPDDFEELANLFVNKVKSWPQFNDLSTQVLTSGCIQALVMSVRKNAKLSKTIIKKVLEACEGKSDFDDEKNQPLLHLIEAAIVAAPPKLFSKFLNLFHGQLAELSISKTSNFVVQKLILHCVVKEDFEEIFDKVVGVIDKLIDRNFTGVVLALAKSCRRLKTKQGEFTNILVNVLQCNDPPERRSQMVPLIACLVRFDDYKPETSKIHLHGSLILQEMFYFTKPIRLVTSLLAMANENLEKMLCDPRGCHITDAYVGSSFVGEKSREKLFKKLQKRYATLAASKHGSRSFDEIWRFLNQKQKIQVMEELKAEQGLVVSTVSGRVIVSKTRLDLFRHDKDTWMKEFSDKVKHGGRDSVV